MTYLSAQTKHALIFGIGNYPKSGGWPQLSSIRDVSYVTQALMKQGFSVNNIRSVTDAAATVKGISAALTLLIEEVHSGDIVVIHFSSHGEQVEDDNNDEMDGYDECIVTYNAVIPSRSKNFQKDQSQYFRDDELGRYLSKLRRKLGAAGDIVVFMDLCHSGSGTRGLVKVRGGQPPFVSSTFDSKRFADHDTLSLYDIRSDLNAGQTSLASYVVYSAAKAEELDYEIIDESKVGMGSLSYAICKSLENLNEGASYRYLFGKIKSVIHIKLQNQHPVIEGNGIDREIFGGTFIEQKPYIEILSQENGKLTLNAGRFFGLDEGAKIALYPAGTKDPAASSSVSSGTIIRADNYKAVASVKNGSLIANTALYWVFVTDPVYRMPPLNIHLISISENALTGFSEAEITRIKTALKEMRTVTFEGNAQLLISKGREVDSIKVALNGYLYKTFKTDDMMVFKKIIQDYAQYQFLSGLEITNPAVSVQVKLIPFINGKADTSQLRSKQPGNYEFTDSDTIVIWARNTSSIPVFINILDLQPDGFINPVFPDSGHNIYAQDLKIERHQSRLFSRFPLCIEKPYGTEIFKVFASAKEIDLESIVTKRSATRGNASVLERLLKSSYDASESGTENHDISKADGSTFNILFNIKPSR